MAAALRQCALHGKHPLEQRNRNEVSRRLDPALRRLKWFTVSLTAAGALQSAPSAVTTSTYAGRVFDGATGAPIAGASVVLGSVETRTDSQGDFRIEGRGGQIGARAAGYRRAATSVEAPAQSMRDRKSV